MFHPSFILWLPYRMFWFQAYQEQIVFHDHGVTCFILPPLLSGLLFIRIFICSYCLVFLIFSSFSLYYYYFFYLNLFFSPFFSPSPPLHVILKLQGEKDWEKYEVARKLKSCVEDIRTQYLHDLRSKQMVTRQRAVALYFIDKVWF